MEEEYIDVHNAKGRYEQALSAFLSDRQISEHNRELVERFLRDAALGKTVKGRAKRKIGVSRLSSYIQHLTHLLLFLDQALDEVSQEDMERFIEALESGQILSRSPNVSGGTKDKPLSPRYAVDLKASVKKFYTWLLGNCERAPPLVDWFDTHAERDDIPALTPVEVERLVDAAPSVKMRALIQVLFDGGFRIGELLNVRLHHVTLRALPNGSPGERVFVVRVPFSKTTRRSVALPLPASTKWLSLWLEEHLAQPEVQKDGTLKTEEIRTPLFPMNPCAVRSAIRRAGERALGKRVYPHLLRHTSATFWSNRLPHYRFCKRFGWSMTSQMPQRYIDREGVDELEMMGGQGLKSLGSAGSLAVGVAQPLGRQRPRPDTWAG